MVLHEKRGTPAREVYPGGDADALLLLRQSDEGHVGVFVGEPDEMKEPRLRQRRDDPHTGGSQRLIRKL